MVLDFFNLREQPFGVTPDPRFWFASATHREALASLLYGLEAERGFVALIANPGMGKTTLLFNGLQRINNRVRTVFLFQRITSVKSLLQALLADLGVTEIRGSLIELQRKLNDVCAEQARSGKRLVVVIDEAQNLDEPVLEFVRMLSNFETSSRKLIQVVLAGQFQLAEKMASPSLTQLRQRISIFAYLKPLSEHETASYIDHRLRTAGYSANLPLFAPSALELIAQHSHGIPRNINNLCFNAMSVGFALKRRTIDDDVLREVIADLSLESFTNQGQSQDQAQHQAQDQAQDQAAENSCLPVPQEVPTLRSQPIEDRPPARTRPTLHEVMLDLDRRLSGRSRVIAARPSICEAHIEPGQRPAGADAPTRIEPGKDGSRLSRLFMPALTRPSGGRARLMPGSLYRSAGAGVLFTMLVCSLTMVLLKQDHLAAATAPSGTLALPASAIETPSSPHPGPAPSQPPPPKSVVVKAGHSLLDVCAENFADCTPDLLAKIRELNPGIRSANQIEPGQKIRIPSTDLVNPSAEQAVSDSRIRRETP
jgi:type II secretory pathway predicted ATPase ExeA